MTTHEEIEELLGAYALDALAPDEAAAIEAHLATCPRCTAELAAHREVTGLFAYSGQEAPPGLWDRIMAGIHEAPPELRLDRIRSSMVRASDVDDSYHAGRVKAGRSSGPRWRWVMSIAAAVAIVVAGLGVEVSHLQSRVDDLAASRAATVPGLSMKVVDAAIKAPGSRTVKLTGGHGSKSWLDAVLTPSGHDYVFDAHLTPLTSDRTYQLWGAEGASAVSLGLLGTDPGIVPFFAGPGLKALMVTDEVASGVVMSTHEPVVLGDVKQPL